METRCRPKKPLENVTKRQMHRRTEDLVGQVANFAETEGIDVSKLLGYIGNAYYGQKTDNARYDKTKANMFKRVYNGATPFEQVNIKPETGLQIQRCLEIGDAKYRNLRKILLASDVNLPPTEDVREYKKKVVPKYEEFLNGKWITLETIVSHYVGELLDSKLTESRNVFKLLAAEGINVEVSAGFDASGRHSKVKSFGDCSDHLILGGLRVIRVTIQTNDMIFHEDFQAILFICKKNRRTTRTVTHYCARSHWL